MWTDHSEAQACTDKVPPPPLTHIIGNRLCCEARSPLTVQNYVDSLLGDENSVQAARHLTQQRHEHRLQAARIRTCFSYTSVSHTGVSRTGVSWPPEYCRQPMRTGAECVRHTSLERDTKACSHNRWSHLQQLACMFTQQMDGATDSTFNRQPMVPPTAIHLHVEGKSNDGKRLRTVLVHLRGSRPMQDGGVVRWHSLLIGNISKENKYN